MGQAEPSTWYHTLRIGKHAAAPFYSTVLHVPSLMTKTECEALIAAADAHLNVLFDQHVGRHGGHAWPPWVSTPRAISRPTASAGPPRPALGAATASRRVPFTDTPARLHRLAG